MVSTAHSSYSNLSGQPGQPVSTHAAATAECCPASQQPDAQDKLSIGSLLKTASCSRLEASNSSSSNPTV